MYVENNVWPYSELTYLHSLTVLLANALTPEINSANDFIEI